MLGSSGDPLPGTVLFHVKGLIRKAGVRVRCAGTLKVIDSRKVFQARADDVCDAAAGSVQEHDTHLETQRRRLRARDPRSSLTSSLLSHFRPCPGGRWSTPALSVQVPNALAALF